MKKITLLCAGFAAVLLSGCAGSAQLDGKKYNDYTGAFWARYGVGYQKDAETAMGAVHQGFRIDPMPGTDWVVLYHLQRPNFAMWGKKNGAADVLPHTSEAQVHAAAVPGQKNFTYADLAKIVEGKLRSGQNDKIKDMKYTVKEGTRNGAVSAEFQFEYKDYSTMPVSRIAAEGFLTVTKENKILAVTVMERSMDPKFKYTGADAKEFMSFLKW